MNHRSPSHRAQRLVCLSAESAEILAQIGAWDKIVGVSAYIDQTGRERKPVISGFARADAQRVAALQPDLVFTFSDVQAEITAELLRAGCQVLATNPRTLADIEESIRLIARTVGREAEGWRLADVFRRDLEGLVLVPARRVRVYFEEWPDPMISAIGWVGELIELCGGIDVFAERRGPASRDRVVTSEEVIAAAPELIVASWCGKPADLPAMRARAGWDTIPAVQNGYLFELDSDGLLQPGPRLLQGGRELALLINRCLANTHPAHSNGG